MSLKKYSCGPNAYDEINYQDSYKNGNRTIHTSSHTISGNGIVSTCSASNGGNWEETYVIKDGITELGDECFNRSGIISVKLPSTLKTIGNKCFIATRIGSLELPAGLLKIGHNNFPASLKSLTIPVNIDLFDVDNVVNCTSLESLLVAYGNKSFVSIDGILYNADKTEILFCPNAKKGKVIIPNSVKKIGDYCFANCKSLSSIIIPPTVETIGKNAFASIEIPRLIIPNSVIEVQEACFIDCQITEEFRLSKSISSLPGVCFVRSQLPNYSFLKEIKAIGYWCFYFIKTNSMQGCLSLRKAQSLGERSFGKQNIVKLFSLYNPNIKIESHVFEGTSTIRYFSYVPTRQISGAFDGMSIPSTLIIPENTKIIFENAYPWSCFSNIIEMPLDQNPTEDPTTVDADELLFRLKCVNQSIQEVDRNYIKEILEVASLSYLDIETDEDFEQAMNIIRYNRKFSPIIIQDLDQRIIGNWPISYKLKYYKEAVTKFPQIVVPQSLTSADDQDKALSGVKLLDIGIKMDIPIEECESISDEAYFANILKVLQNELSLAQHNVKIAVSWFTNYALFKQIKELAQRGIRIQLIINNDSVNNGGYCLNYNELIEAGVELSLVEFPHLLHHKFCIIDDCALINGSFNWTRLSGINYENVIVIKTNQKLVNSFIEEFQRRLDEAEYKVIDRMPDTVPQRPEYDRMAFKQFITEELDEQARESPDERDKIRALSAAAKLNPNYLDKINPGVRKQYEEQFKVLEQSSQVANTIVNIVQEQKETTPVPQPPTTLISTPNKLEDPKEGKGTQFSNKPKVVSSSTPEKVINEVKASSLFMAMDVSGSMENTYRLGHAQEIATIAFLASEAISESKVLSLWTFDLYSYHIADIDINKTDIIKNVKCSNRGTSLNSFVSNALPTIKDGALVIILTDDDGSSIQGAIGSMSNKNKVFWQIISYEQQCNNIANAIRNINNISLVCLHNYASKDRTEIVNIMLKDYITWKTTQA